jgi:hypothetical protein
MRGLIGAAATLAVAVAGGFAIGVALERSGRVDPVAEPDPATVRDSRAVAFDCPGGTVVVALGRADRVAVVGRDEPGDWLELRSPLDQSAVVWMPSAQIDLDGRVGALPVHQCGEPPPPTPPTIPANPADDRPRTTTTTTARSPATTTTEGDSPTTTADDGSSSTTTTTTTDDGSSSTTSSSTTSTSASTTSTTEAVEPGEAP